MQRLRIRFLLTLALSGALPAGLASAQPAAGSTSPADLASLRAAERQRAEAVASRDVATLRGLISGDYYHVETNGRFRTKTEFLQLLERDVYEFRSYKVDNMEIRLFDGGRAALVAGRFHAEIQTPNRPRELRGRYIRLWSLGPDGWRNTMQQSTEIRPAAPLRTTRPQR